MCVCMCRSGETVYAKRNDRCRCTGSGSVGRCSVATVSGMDLSIVMVVLVVRRVPLLERSSSSHSALQADERPA